MTKKASKNQENKKTVNKKLFYCRKEEEKLGMSHAAKGIPKKVRSLCKDYEYERTLDRSCHELPLSGGKVIDSKALDVRSREHKGRWSFELKVSYQSENPDPDGRWKKSSNSSAKASR